jgi:spore coat polysaccharide biosynthesis predicted glycosyltransferase SpsG
VWLAVIDDCYRLPFPANLVINPNVYAEPQRYLATSRQAMGGADCVILRQPIVRSAGTFQVRHDLKRVLLTLGGSDLYHLGSNLATKLAALGFAVDWISSNPSEVACVAREVRMHAPLGAEAFVQLVLANDAVLCGGGQTLHELACMGVPCVAIEQGEDQHLNLNIYEQAGYLGARIQGQGADVLKDVAARFEILRSRDLREKLSTLGRSMGDGMGAHRLAARILRRD